MKIDHPGPTPGPNWLLLGVVWLFVLVLSGCSTSSQSEREIEVLREVADGNRNREIAERLIISEETVKVHIKHIMEKLGASDRTQAVSIGLRRGIIQLP